MLLADEEDVRIIDEAGTAEDAVNSIAEHAPDLVFLDVQLPEADGFDVIARLNLDRPPLIIFVTAHDEYAVRAFEASAVDYLLKPVGAERLAAALDRVRERRRGGVRSTQEAGAHLKSLLEQYPAGGMYRERFAVRTGNRFTILRAPEIVSLRAADNYVKLHAGKETYMIRGKISELEKVLDPRKFLRIHRSAIVNIDHVVAIEPWGVGEHLFLLGNGEKLTSSRGFRHKVREVFGC